MNEHEGLKEICDVIGYNPIWYWTYMDESSWYSEIWFYRDGSEDSYYPDVNVREIIFTQEFMDEFVLFLEKNWYYYSAEDQFEWVLENLNNPVDYLYKTLWLWTD